ncbi:MAG: GNAT family N-acetyltransferase [Pseudomonadota bacterium]
MAQPSHIRRAEISDTEGIRACIEAAYSVYQDRIADLPDVAAEIEDQIRNDTVLVQIYDEQISGCAVLDLAAERAKLVNIAVSPLSSGKGLGKALILECERVCITHRCNELDLVTHTNMQGNIDLYTHLGWRETGRSGNKVNMTKTLS